MSGPFGFWSFLFQGINDPRPHGEGGESGINFANLCFIGWPKVSISFHSVMFIDGFG